MNEEQELIVKASLLAGKIMLQSGAETSRVEDTMERIIRNSLGIKKEQNAFTYVTVNGIFVKLDNTSTYFERIDSRDHDLDKVTKVNQISRSFADGTITLPEVCVALQKVEAENNHPPIWLKLICTCILSGSIMLILGGTYIDLPAAMIAGLFSYAMYLLLLKYIQLPFFSEYGATFIGGTVGYFISQYIGHNINIVMIGAVAPLVPGLAITNAIRDMMAKHYLSGLIRAVEGIFIAAAIGAGVATVFYLFIN